MSTPSTLLWPPPTPAPLSPVSWVLHLSGSTLPVHLSGWHPKGLPPQADWGGPPEADSCSVMGCVLVPLPIRRRVLGCCFSKYFAPSMAFATKPLARLPLVPCLSRGEVTAQQDSSSYGPFTRSAPKGPSSWRFDGRISPSAGHQLRGCLATTPTGLTPASPSQLRRTHGLVPPLAGLAPASRCELQDAQRSEGPRTSLCCYEVLRCAQEISQPLAR